MLWQMDRRERGEGRMHRLRVALPEGRGGDKRRGEGGVWARRKDNIVDRYPTMMIGGELVYMVRSATRRAAAGRAMRIQIPAQ